MAGTLEAARVLSLRPHARTLVVACGDEEERGLIGSSAYVARARAAGDDIVLALVFEMIGYRSTAPNSQQSDPTLEAVFPDAGAQIAANDYRGDFALVVNDESATAAVTDLQATATTVGLPVVNISLLAPLKTSIDDLRRSDHAPFWDADYPALFITDTAKAGVCPSDASMARSAIFTTSAVSAAIPPVSVSAAASNSPPASGSSITSTTPPRARAFLRSYLRRSSTRANSRLIVDSDGSGEIRCLRRSSNASFVVTRGLISRAVCTTCLHATDTSGSREIRESINASNPCVR